MRDLLETANIAKSRGLALQGGAFGLVLALVSIMTVRVGPMSASFGMIPLIAIFIWPRGASKGLSALCIFLIGLTVDLLSAGPAGLWALLFLFFYGVFQPDQRHRSVKFYGLWLRFTGWVVVATVLISVMGALFIPGRTAYLPLLLQAVMAALMFPALYVIRQVLRQIILDPNEPSLHSG